MKICFPVAHDEGLKSYIYGHFGSAPTFVVVDTELRETKAISNCNQLHTHCTCKPLTALKEEGVDTLVVSSIGITALQGCNQAGLKVYQAQGITINDNITCMEQAGLPEFAIAHSCRRHDN